MTRLIVLVAHRHPFSPNVLNGLVDCFDVKSHAHLSSGDFFFFFFCVQEIWGAILSLDPAKIEGETDFFKSGAGSMQVTRCGGL